MSAWVRWNVGISGELGKRKGPELVQALLEEEVTELLGRAKSDRREAVDAAVGYRNGHGKPRRLTMGSGTITVRRPRVRDLEERFESQALPFAKRTGEVDGLIPELYLRFLNVRGRLHRLLHLRTF